MELYLPSERPQREANGRLLPGHKGLNKGKKRTEFMNAKTDRRLKELGAKRFREQKHPENSGRKRRPVVMLSGNGHFAVFRSTADAARAIHGQAANVRRCCKENASKNKKRSCYRLTGSNESVSLINTDHSYKGFRFYYENDNSWISKIRQ